MNIHIGSTIKDYCYQNRISVADLCKKIGMDTSSVYRIFSRPHISTETLLIFSNILKHNFFQYFWKDENLPLSEEYLKLQQELFEAKKLIESLRRENDLLNRIVEKSNPI